MNKVLLLFPQFNTYGFGKDWKFMESVMPPIGLLYLATPLINKGYDVDFIDLNVTKLEKSDFLKRTMDRDFILITCFSYALKNIENIIKDIKEVNKKSVIICGGPHCTLFKKPFKGADYTFIGEAEHVITELLESIAENKSLSNFSGLIYKKKGKIIKNPGFMCINDLDSGDWPYLDIVNMEDYGKISGLHLKIAPVLTSRGCPYQCTYCTFKLSKYREVSIKKVFDEIKKLYEKGFEYIFFCDDNLLLKKERVIRLMDMIISERVKIRFILQARVDTADYELYKKLREAGAIIILFGIENINQDVLDFYNKAVSVEQIKRAVDIADSLGILTIGFIMYGSPVETIEHFKRMDDYFKSSKLDLVIAGVLNYTKGTKIWEDAYKKGLIKNNQLSVLANRRLSNFTSDELDNVKNNFVKNFYSNPIRLFRIITKFFMLSLLPAFFKALFKNGLYKYSTQPYMEDNKKIVIEE